MEAFFSCEKTLENHGKISAWFMGKSPLMDDIWRIFFGGYGWMIIQVPDPSGSPGACDSHESPPTAEHYALRCERHRGLGVGFGVSPRAVSIIYEFTHFSSYNSFNSYISYMLTFVNKVVGCI